MCRTKWVFYLSLLLIAVGCGGETKKDNPVGNAGSGGQSTTEGDAPDTSLDKGPKVVVKPANCGDKTVVAPEECDDGNNIDNDGCSNLCTYSCTSDTGCEGEKSDCSGGVTCDLAAHKCVPSGAKAPNDQKCGDNSFCYEGKCYTVECGNGVTQKGEECDDGNSDDADGCTKKCTYSCGSTIEVGRVEQNVCDPTASCDPNTHKWTKGKPFDDGLPCKRGQGYCSAGVCVLSVCGDGKVDPNEQCDEGLEINGTAGKCSKTCTPGVCGNKTIDKGEECDDGNTTDFDGCDFRCKAEVTYRGASFAIATEDAPSYCMYAKTPNKGNAFKTLFPIGEGQTSNAILDLINTAITDSMVKGEVVTIFQGFDVDDYSGKIPDPVMSIGISMGKSRDVWPADGGVPTPDQTLDIPVLGYKASFENGQPKKIFTGETALIDGKAVIRSTTLVTAGFSVMGMNWVLSNLYAYMPVDPKFTRLPEPLKTVEGLTIPETIGNAFQTPDAPTVVLCGAFKEADFKKIPLIDILGAVCIDEFLVNTISGKPSYVACTEDNAVKQLQEGRCDSFYEVFKGGCHALTITILNPIGEPDVDTDGDKKNDAFSIVVRASGQRARLQGLTDPPDGGTAE